MHVELHIYSGSESIRVRGVKKGDAWLRWYCIQPWLILWYWFTEWVLGWPYEFRLEDLVQLKNSAYTDLLIIYHADTDRAQQDLLSKEMRLLLLQWLMNVNQLDHTFDCFSFANTLHKNKFLRPIDGAYIVHGPWSGSEIRESETPSIGDMMIFCNTETNESKHFAIYIADDLYLSKCGMGGPIYVCNSRSLLNTYDCNFYMLINKICCHCKCYV